MTTSNGAVISTTQIFGSAPRNRAFTIVLLAEGFTAIQQSAFDAAGERLRHRPEGTPRFDDLSSAINVRSTDSGADDPASAGGTGATAHLLPRAPASTPRSAATASAACCWSTRPPR